MKDRVQQGSQVLDKVWDLYDEARQSYLDHDGRFPGAKLRKLAGYCLKVAGKSVKARVVDETHHWIAGDGKKYWVFRNSLGQFSISTDVRDAFRFGCPGAAKSALGDTAVKCHIRTLVKPGKFGVYLLNEKVEVSPCRG